ncbi:flagellar FliJ family protein [Brockia lithotrophica]|uniref:Flagellar FliJ protein n=1 Tax=Brockia lithotrophica TaxID=933949 RepID=A0A660KVZ7_9BACL|nr:flagellar FliJ family protein [Brockia lithotrophica]RKQ84193.1 flagellar export protein FliJ [Brockia lithotrophica]
MNRWYRLEHLAHVESLVRAGELRSLRDWAERLEDDLTRLLEEKHRTEYALTRTGPGTVLDMQTAYSYLAELRGTAQALAGRLEEARRRAEEAEEAVREKRTERERYRVLLGWEAERVRRETLRREQGEIDALAVRFVRMRSPGADSET